MPFFKQTAAVVAIVVRSIPQRYASSVVTVVGIAGVVAVLISVLALSTGLANSLAMSGSSARAIILQKQVSSEVTSALSRSTVATILEAPGIRRGADRVPVASAEVLATVNLPRQDDGTLTAITLRGVSPTLFTLRPEVRLIQGRGIGRGVRELLVGKSAQKRVRGLNVGSRVHIVDTDWIIVGTFDSGGSARDSELLADSETMLSAYRSNSFNSVTVSLADGHAMTRLSAALASDPTVSVDVISESEYYARQSKTFSTILTGIARIVGSIMAIGAVFAALNTMYSAVATRKREIATLKTIGFRPVSIVISVMTEALTLAVAGAFLGAALAYAVFDGHVVSTISGSGSVGQVVFDLKVGTGLILLGVAWACGLGLVGGLLPAIRAARQPIATALRAI